MSKEALAKVVQRAISDAGFRRQLNSDPAGALRGFDLSADELSALRTGNAGRLSTLGIDQRMSKAFAIGGAVGATRMAQSDLNAGSATIIDDTSGIGGKTAIPADPDRAITADVDGGTGGTTGSVRAGDDYKFAGRTAPESTSTVRIAPVEGSPEATAADIAAGGSARSAVNDDPDGFLAANANADLSGGASSGATSVAEDSEAYLTKVGYDSNVAANADTSGSAARASAVHDDPDGFLAANANADLSGSAARASAVNDDADGFLAANANADLSGGTRGDGTAFLDESEAYLSKVGYDANAATSAVTDAHDRGSLGTSAVTDAHDRGDVTRIDDDADGAGTSATSEGGPNISS